MKYFIRFFILFLLIPFYLNAAQLSDNFRLDGYADVSTYSTNDDTDTQNHKINITGGIQGRYQINDDISATGQFYLYEDKSPNPKNKIGVDTNWLYFDYYLGNDITLRAGRFQLPVFKSLETGSIGYTITPTENPLKIYGAHGYENFSGAELLSSRFYDDIELQIQLSYGSADAKLPPQAGSITETKTDSLNAATFKVLGEDYWVNLGYLQARSDITIRNLNRNTTRKSNSKLKMLALETGIDIDDYTIKGGIIDADISDTIPNEFRYYGSLEYNYDDFTPYIYFASEKLTNKVSQISAPPFSGPPPLNAPPPLPRNLEQKSETFSIGLRYELDENIALKGSYIYERLKDKRQNIQTNVISTDTEDHSTFKVVLNVIF